LSIRLHISTTFDDYYMWRVNQVDSGQFQAVYGNSSISFLTFSSSSSVPSLPEM
jgi:hypothetical protein